MSKPRHIGIIMDGNRRFAKSLNLSPWKGHEFGEKKVFELLNWCEELDIKEVTVYAFSIQNLNRPKREFNYLMNIFSGVLDKILLDKDLKEKGVKFRFLGDICCFPVELQEKLKRVAKLSENNDKYFFNVALGYGGREEILRAVKNIVLEVEKGHLSSKDISQEVFQSYLYMSSEPDLIIRTGGDHRTSNFLPWQSTYSEWFFLDKKWPEFSKEDLAKCINEFSRRERRFGK